MCSMFHIALADRQHENDPHFRNFRRQLFHTTLHYILQPLRAGMETPEVVKCADGHFRRIVWSLGPYIADYPEQVLLSGVVQGWCPRYVSDAILPVVCCNAHRSCRCTAPPYDLDGEGYVRRSHVHTRALLDTFDAKALWDDYGIVSHIVVSLFPLSPLSRCLHKRLTC